MHSALTLAQDHTALKSRVDYRLIKERGRTVLKQRGSLVRGWSGSTAQGGSFSCSFHHREEAALASPGGSRVRAPELPLTSEALWDSLFFIYKREGIMPVKYCEVSSSRCWNERCIPLDVWLSLSVQLLSRVWLFGTPRTAGRQASLSISNSRSLLKLMFIKSVMPSNHLIICHPLLLPSIIASIRGFSSESVLRMRWPKYWSFSFNISPSNEYSGLISFRMDWLDLLAVQGTLKSLLQHHSSKASSVLSFLYSPTLTSIHDYWKNHSFDYLDLCQQSNVSAFLICCIGWA